MPFQEKVKKVDIFVNLFGKLLGARVSILLQFHRTLLVATPPPSDRNVRAEALKHTRQKYR